MNQSNAAFQPLIYRINEATRQLGISRGTLYKLVKSGDLVLVKIGTRASGITIESINKHIGRDQ